MKPNDIDLEIDSVETLVNHLPPGWRPDLVVYIQSGIPPVERIDWLTCPTTYISVDTWHDFAEFQFALPYDFVFASQREFVAHFTASGARNASWLPLACDPDAHYPVECTKEFDIGFVGSIERSLHSDRAARLERLGNQFSVFTGSALHCDAMCAVYARARLGFNSSIAQDVNMRVFEIMAMGVPLLTNRDAESNGLLELFEDEVHLITYDDDDIIERTQHYLEDAALRDQIGRLAQEIVLAKHTYDHRVQHIVETVFNAVDLSGVRKRPVLCGHTTLHDYIPTAPGVVGDFALSAQVTKYGMRQLGAVRTCAVVYRNHVVGHRTASYDAVYTADSMIERSWQIDTLLMVSREDFRIAPEVLSLVHRALSPGGTVVACVSHRDATAMQAGERPEALWKIFDAAGFAVVRLELVESARDNAVAAFVVARKRLRSAKEIARDIYTRNPIAGITLEEVLARIP